MIIDIILGICVSLNLIALIAVAIGRIRNRKVVHFVDQLPLKGKKYHIYILNNMEEDVIAFAYIKKRWVKL